MNDLAELVTGHARLTRAGDGKCQTAGVGDFGWAVFDPFLEGWGGHRGMYWRGVEFSAK